jgi:phosphate transport system substrate-binding protein
LVLVFAMGLVSAAAAEPPGPAVRLMVDASIGSYTGKPGVSGNIAIAGSDTMQPIVAKVASVFRQWHPDVKIAIQGGGSDAALKGFLQNQSTIRRGDANPKGHQVSGHVDLLASSRAMTAEEREDFRSRYGHDPIEMPIALDAVAIYVNRDNPIQGLTMAQLDAMFGKARKRGLPESITTWGQLGLTGGWEQQPIHLYGQDKRSGTRTFFIHKVLGDGDIKAEVTEEPGPAMEILRISRDPVGIGYAGIGFLASTVLVLPLAEEAGTPYVQPSAATAADGTYPLARSLYLYAKKGQGSDMDPEVLEFLKFVNSREGQLAVAKSGYYPLPAPQVAKNLQVLTGAPAAAFLQVSGTK